MLHKSSIPHLISIYLYLWRSPSPPARAALYASHSSFTSCYSTLRIRNISSIKEPAAETKLLHQNGRDFLGACALLIIYQGQLRPSQYGGVGTQQRLPAIRRWWKLPRICALFRTDWWRWMTNDEWSRLSCKVLFLLACMGRSSLTPTQLTSFIKG